MMGRVRRRTSGGAERRWSQTVQRTKDSKKEKCIVWKRTKKGNNRLEKEEEEEVKRKQGERG